MNLFYISKCFRVRTESMCSIETFPRIIDYDCLMLMMLTRVIWVEHISIVHFLTRNNNVR